MDLLGLSFSYENGFSSDFSIGSLAIEYRRVEDGEMALPCVGFFLKVSKGGVSMELASARSMILVRA